jgi:hypothetical protein
MFIPRKAEALPSSGRTIDDYWIGGCSDEATAQRNLQRILHRDMLLACLSTLESRGLCACVPDLQPEGLRGCSSASVAHGRMAWVEGTGPRSMEDALTPAGRAGVLSSRDSHASALIDQVILTPCIEHRVLHL